MDPCAHVSELGAVSPSGNGCQQCLATGGTWLHLRLCMHCGHVGCCDDSPNRHARGHWQALPGHPVIRSFEPGEDWWWCYAHDFGFYVRGAEPAPSHS